MLKNLPQLVPQEVCLSCDGCCRFKEHDSQFRPKVTKEEVDQIHAHRGSLAEKIFSKGMVDENNYLRTAECMGGFHCTFFNTHDHTCGICETRPFECQLYPILLIKKGEGITVGVHLNCPYVQEKRDSLLFEDYILRLKEFLLKDENLEFLQRNISVAGEYSAYQSEIECLFTLPLKA